MTPYIGLISGLIGAIVGAWVAAWATARREQRTAIRSAIADILAASTELDTLLFEAAANSELDADRFDTVQRAFTQAEYRLWFTTAKPDLLAQARRVSELTGDVASSWHEDPREFTARRVSLQRAHTDLLHRTAAETKVPANTVLPFHLDSRIQEVPQD